MGFEKGFFRGFPFCSPTLFGKLNNPKKAYAIAGKAVRHWLAILNLVCTLLDEKIQANFKQLFICYLLEYASHS